MIILSNSIDLHPVSSHHFGTHLLLPSHLIFFDLLLLLQKSRLTRKHKEVVVSRKQRHTLARPGACSSVRSMLPLFQIRQSEAILQYPLVHARRPNLDLA